MRKRERKFLADINYIALKNKFIIESRKLAIKYPEAFFTRDKSDRTYQEKVYLYLDSGIYRLERFMQQHPELKSSFSFPPLIKYPDYYNKHPNKYQAFC